MALSHEENTLIHEIYNNARVIARELEAKKNIYEKKKGQELRIWVSRNKTKRRPERNNTRRTVTHQQKMCAENKL